MTSGSGNNGFRHLIVGSTGTFVNRETISRLTRMSLGSNLIVSKVVVNSVKFFTWASFLPRGGFSRPDVSYIVS